jgi:hypothetical protein
MMGLHASQALRSFAPPRLRLSAQWIARPTVQQIPCKPAEFSERGQARLKRTNQQGANKRINFAICENISCKTAAAAYNRA